MNHSFHLGQEKIAELLIQRGANIEIKDTFGRTPLHESAAKGY